MPQLDLGALHHFLGISVTRSSDGLFLSQRQCSMLLSFSNVLACPGGVSSYHDACGLKSPSSPLQMAPQSPILPSTIASPGRYKTLLTPAPTWPMRSSRCASSWTTLGSRTLPLSNAFSTASRALFLLVYTLAPVLSGLGRVPRLPPLHIGLLRLPRRHLGALVVQASDHYLSL